MFQKLLIATELTDGLDRLARLVPSLAAGGIRQIVFVYVVPLQDSRIPHPDPAKLALAQQRLAVAQEQVPPGCSVELVIKPGQPIEVIAQTASQFQSQLIVLGTPIRALLEEKLFGSTTMGLSQRLHVPLISLRPQLISTFTLEELDLRCRHLLRHLLIPLEDTAAAKALIQQIVKAVQTLGPGSLEVCTLCQIVDTGSRRGLEPAQALAQAQQTLAPARAQLEALGLKVQTEVRRGDPVTEILKLAQEQDVSALALSSAHAGTLWELSVQSVCGDLLRRSWHPVIFFPTQP